MLPVASVTSEITANDNIKDEIVENTKWCVNDKANMIALPLFEMTFLHYLIQGDAAPPPFASLPMHNYDHAAFQKEVADHLKQIGADAEDNTADHEEVTAELLGALNGLRDKYKPDLAARGTRGKTTHGEFIYAMNAPEGDQAAEQWYIPFSMAAKPSPQPFRPALGRVGWTRNSPT